MFRTNRELRDEAKRLEDKLHEESQEKLRYEHEAKSRKDAMKHLQDLIDSYRKEKRELEKELEMYKRFISNIGFSV